MAPGDGGSQGGAYRPLTDRRTVRATSELFDDLDRQLPAERGQNGEPSRRDFEVFELLPLVDEIAERWDELPRLDADLPDYRILVKRGLLVPWLTVVAHLTPDGALELVALDIDAER